jgi:cyclophilin family peptidyl-prolyl cis-trans isomerase
MSIRENHRQRFLGGLLVVTALTLLTMAGCSQGGNNADEKDSEANPNVAAGGPMAKDEAARLQQPFKDAVLLEPPIEDLQRPPDLTPAGKNVAKIFEAIAGKDNQGGLWDQVRFTDAEGRLLRYRAVLTTSLGEIHIELYPQAAPNHVRSFIALARAGYFEGMPIYRSVREMDGDTVAAAYIESGCPRGDGEIGYGSIGYWLKPEIKGNKLTHEEGAVGAWHQQELETAACRFYITAEKMPQMDGAFTVFGKVTHGLDLVRRINTSPVMDTTTQRLKEPVPIQSVTIQVLEEELAANR